MKISDNPPWREGMRLQVPCGKRTRSGKACQRFVTGVLVSASMGYVQPDQKGWPILDLRNMEWRCYQHSDVEQNGEECHEGADR